MQENITFENRQAQVLSGVLHTPDNGQTRACALFAHCFTCTKNSKAAVRISEALAAEGIEVLRFDFTGLGQSEGDFSNTDFSSNVDDLVDAAAFMGTRGASPSLLIGHSLGGTAVLAAAHEIDSALAVATIGASKFTNGIVSRNVITTPGKKTRMPLLLRNVATSGSGAWRRATNSKYSRPRR